MEPKRLYRSETDRMIAGVCGGLGEYFQIDPVIVRLIAVLLALASGGTAIIAYILLWIIIPTSSRIGAPTQEVMRENVESIRERAEEFGQGVRAAFGQGQPTAEGQTQPTTAPSGTWLVGALIILIGLIFLLQNFGVFWWWKWGYLWPVILILIGVALLVRRR